MCARLSRAGIFRGVNLKQRKQQTTIPNDENRDGQGSDETTGEATESRCEACAGADAQKALPEGELITHAAALERVLRRADQAQVLRGLYLPRILLRMAELYPVEVKSVKRGGVRRWKITMWDF